MSNAYQQVVWVYRAVNALAEQVSNIPFRFSRTNSAGEELITTGPLVDFYSRPHPQINRFEYWELRVIWLMLRGEWFRVPIFDSEAGGGRPGLKAVLILDPARFQHIVEDNRLMGWRYIDYSRNSPLSSQVFLPEEVWHEKLPNPFDFWRGMPPLAVAATAAGTDYAASLFMKGIMENNGEAGTILRTSEQLDPEQREQLLATLRERKRRAGTADRPVLLWGGAEVVTPKLASSDLQFLANRKFSCTEICAAFGVPEAGEGTVAGSKLQVPGPRGRPGTDVFTRLAAALNMDGKRLLGTPASAEEFGDVVRAGAKEPEGAARFVGNGQTAFVVGRDAGSARLKGGAPSAEKQPE